MIEFYLKPLKPVSNRWVLELQCGGSRNFLSAYRTAVENDEEIKHNICKFSRHSQKTCSIVIFEVVMAQSHLTVLRNISVKNYK